MLHGLGASASGLRRRGFGVGASASGLRRRGFGVGASASGLRQYSIVYSIYLVLSWLYTKVDIR